MTAALFAINASLYDSAIADEQSNTAENIVWALDMSHEPFTFDPTHILDLGMPRETETSSRFTELTLDHDFQEKSNGLDLVPLINGVTFATEDAGNHEVEEEAAAVMHMAKKPRTRRRFQDCEYESVELPCTLCKQRGFLCGSDEKVLGPKALLKLQNGQGEVLDRQFVFSIRPAPGLPKDEALTDLDRKYLSLLGCTFAFGNIVLPDVVFLEISPSHLDSPGTFLPSFTLSSKSFRYAYLAFAAAQLTRPKTNPDALEYIGKFYRYGKEAIETSSEVELIVASYMAILHESMQGFDDPNCWWNIHVHFRGMWHAVKRMGCRISRPTILHRLVIQRVCYSSLVLITDECLYKSQFGVCTEDSQLPEKAQDALELTMDVICSDFPFQGTEVDRIYSLETCFDFFLSNYLFLRTRPTTSQTEIKTYAAARSLQRVIQKIIELVPQKRVYEDFLATAGLPSSLSPWESNRDEDPEDGWHGAHYFIMSYLILDSAIPNPSIGTPQPVLYATSLCRLYRIVRTLSDPSSAPLCIVSRGLLWAGIILTRDINAAANEWIRAELWELCCGLTERSRSNARRVEIQNTFEFISRLLDKSNTWTSEKGELCLKLDDADIFRANSMLLILQKTWWE